MDDCVEILMATYNGERYVAEQIDSILSQSHQNIYLKIRDDGSKDNTRPILAEYARKYASKIEVLPSHANVGVKSNFSCLIESSQANYVMFADQDDVWLETKVYDTLKRMKEVENSYEGEIPVLIHTDLIVTDQNLAILNRSFWNYAHLSPYRQRSLNRLLVQNAITGCTMMANKTLLKMAAPIPQEAVMHDWWLALVAAAFGKIDFLNQTTMSYRQHASNAVGAKKRSSIFVFFKNGWDRMIRGRGNPRLTSHQIEKYQQAFVLYQRYQKQLKKSQKNDLEAYLQLKHQNFFKNRYLMLKHRFFKNGFLRNLGAFVFRPLG